MRGYIKIVWGRIAADMKEYGMAVVILFAYVFVVNLIFHAICPVVIFSGFPCPGCGMSRAAACFATGRWQQAWQFHPVIFPIALTAAYFCIRRYLLGRRVTGLKWMIGTVFALLVIVYAVRMYRYFPNRAPYVYTEDNMLARWLPFYERFMKKAFLPSAGL